jgi:hypothetical protein
MVFFPEIFCIFREFLALNPIISDPNCQQKVILTETNLNMFWRVVVVPKIRGVFLRESEIVLEIFPLFFPHISKSHFHYIFSYICEDHFLHIPVTFNTLKKASQTIKNTVNMSRSALIFQV